MKELHIRIKKNFLLIEEDQELFFIGSYGKGIIIHKSDITNHLLKHLAEQPLKKELLQKLAKNFSIPISLAQKLVTRLSKAGVLETFTPNMLLTPMYKRYETQLSYFDLLQPVKTVGKKLNWQKRLEQLHIVIIGIGGIGNFAAISFAAMGVGEITLIDNDKVDNSNLNRQILFAEKDIGRKKTEAAVETLKRLNSRCHLNSVSQQIRSLTSLEKILRKLKRPDLVFISADTPLLPIWVNALTKELACPFIKASYQGSTGFIGPLIEPGGKLFETLVPIEKNWESRTIKEINLLHKHASFIPVNATIANIAVLESVKYLLGMPGLQVKEKRLFFDFSAICIYEE
jgi:molybdopterin-synthase adenylyltransferase